MGLLSFFAGKQKERVTPNGLVEKAKNLQSGQKLMDQLPVDEETKTEAKAYGMALFRQRMKDFWDELI